ncbi:class I SAM-dependent methyltransferase [Terricaulis sp.]|uniref:class I SAM-dependent methyltransferase n=1 Tax=Terricaulis sp. TaxID=2768686 RepID=UPI003A0FE721
MNHPRSTALEYHEQLAATWTSRTHTGGLARRLAFVQNKILPSAPAGSWLDVGCGSGVYSRILAAAGCQVLGIDGSPAMIEEASKLSAQSLNELNAVNYLQVTLNEGLPFPDNLFDGCICFSVLEYLPNPSLTIRELARVVRPGGQILLSIPNRCSAIRAALRIRRLLPRAPESARFLDYSRFSASRSAAKEMCQTAGLRVRRLDLFDPYIPNQLHPLIPPSLIFLVATKALPTAGGIHAI